MEQSKFAAPLLVSGYRGLVQHRSELPATVSLREAAERIVRLYTAWGSRIRQKNGASSRRRPNA